MVQLSISSDHREFFSRTCRSGLVIVILALASTACSSDGSEYPDLNTVPTSSGSSDSLAEARKIEEGLIADRANARYTDEVLRADTSVQAPLTPPPPKIEVEEVKEEVTEEVVREEPAQETETRAPETVEEEAEARAEEQTEEADAASAAVVTQSAASAASSTDAPPEPAAAASDAVEETQAEETAEVTDEVAPVAPLKEEPVAAVSETVEETVEKVEEPQVAASEAPAVEATAPEAKPAAAAPEPAEAVAEETQVAAISEDAVKGTPSYRELADTPPLEIIFFEQGSNRISPEDTQKLTQIAESQLAEGGKLKIVGHASSRTRELSASEYMIANLKASQQRAAAVAEALMKLGVNGDDLILESVSDSFPLSRGGRPSDEARNRRAEIFLLN